MRFLFVVLLLVPAPAEAIGPSWPITDQPRFWVLGEGAHHFSLDGSYFHTKENFDNNGLIVHPPALSHVHYTPVRVHAGYGLARMISLFGQIDFRTITMVNSKNSNVPDGSNAGPGDAFLAMRWLVYRNHQTDRVYPSEWSPETFVFVAEGSWNFPTYAKSAVNKPPLGDESNDFSGIARGVWYTNEWLSFSASFGYVLRTAGYANSLVWNARADASLQERHRIRLWADLTAFEQIHQSNVILNASQTDAIPSGSLIFKSYAPVQRTATLGLGYLASREWEVNVAAYFNASGANSAKGLGGSFGLVWRPYQVPEIKYEEFRQRQIERLEREQSQSHRRDVIRYGLSATILKVSAQKNFFQISYGDKDKIKQGDTFVVLPPNDFSGRPRRPIGWARVVATKTDSSYLHIQERYMPQVVIQPGFEARRVYFREESQ